MDKKQIDVRARQILGKAYLKSIYWKVGMDILERHNDVSSEDYVSVLEYIIKRKSYDDDNSIFNDALENIWKKGNLSEYYFLEKIIPHYPGTSYRIMKKDIEKEVLSKKQPIRDNKKTFRLITETLKNVIEKSVKNKNIESIKEISELCEYSDFNKTKIHKYVADAYLKIGYIEEALKIYSEKNDCSSRYIKRIYS